jgi:hypothetical protein
MSAVLEKTESGGFAAKNTDSNGAVGFEIRPLGLNAEKVIAKRYSQKDETGQPLETWTDIVRRVVGHVSTAEADPKRRDHF